MKQLPRRLTGIFVLAVLAGCGPARRAMSPLAGITPGDQVRIRTHGGLCLDGAWDGMRRRIDFFGPRRSLGVDSVAALWKRSDPQGRWTPIALGSTAVLEPQPCDPALCIACRLEELEPGMRVRVRPTAGSGAPSALLEGMLVRRDRSSLTLDTRYKIPRDAIESLYVKRRGTAKSAKTGALVGGAAGVALGALAGAALAGFCIDSCNEVSNGDKARGALAGAFILGGVGVIVGAGGGAFVGSFVDEWQQIYP